MAPAPRSHHITKGARPASRARPCRWAAAYTVKHGKDPFAGGASDGYQQSFSSGLGHRAAYSTPTHS